MPEVTVLIINYNHGKRLGQCLNGVDGQLFRDFELVVFDNNSSDDSLSRILDHPARPRVVRSPRNVGFARAANLGIQDSDAPFMMLLNPDALLTPPYLGFLVAAAKSDPAIGSLTGKLLRWEGDSASNIVDSTGRAASLGDREWRRTLDRHDAAARVEVERWRGTLVKSTGDGILARFDSPSRAVRAAIGLCQATRRMGIEIRAAIHTGEVEIRSEDLGGIGVHIASRVLSQAAAGEVVVTRTVRDLVTGTDVSFESKGAASLRGVPGEWELFAASLR